MTDFQISNSTIVRMLIILTAFFGGLFLLIGVERQLVWVVTAAFLAIALNPAVTWLTRWMPKRNRTLAIITVFGLAVLTVALIVGELVPPLVQQTTAFVHNAPGYVHELEQAPGWLGETIRHYNLHDRIKTELSQIVAAPGGASGSAVRLVGGLFSGILSTLTILVLTFLMLREGPGWLAKFWSWHSSPQKRRNQDVIAKMYASVTGYVIGNLLTSLICAVATGIVMAILRVPYVVPVALLVGLFDLLPLVGASLGAAVAVLVALLNSLTAAIILLVFFLIYQQFENNFLQPYVFGKTIQMSPLIVFVAALFGAALGGIGGALIAVPIGACLTILAREYLETRVRRTKV